MRLAFSALALSIGAILLTLLRPTETAPAPRESAPARPVESAETLRAEILALRAENEQLADRLQQIEMRQEVLESRPAAAALETRAPVATAQDTASEERLRQLVAALENPDLAPASGLQSVVLDVLESKEREEELDRAERRRQLAEERVSERILDYTERLGLSRGQAEDMHGVLLTAQLGREELFGAMRSEGVFDRNTMRDTMREIRDTTHAELAVILSPEQLDEYVESEGGDRWGGGPGGRGERGPAGRDSTGTNEDRTEGYGRRRE